jgi:hypothetical protein
VGGQAQARHAGFQALGQLPQSQLMQRMRASRLIIANGGSTLLQGIACGAACIGVPIAKDQGERIRRCVQAGLAESASLQSADMLQAALRLWENPRELEALRQRALAAQLADGIDIALRALEDLCRTPC